MYNIIYMNNFSRDEILLATNKIDNKRCFYLDESKNIVYTDNLPPISEATIIAKLIKEREDIPMNELRKLRNAKLQESDKYMILDYPISDEVKNEIKFYRASLRDLPELLKNQQLNVNNLFQNLPVQPNI